MKLTFEQPILLSLVVLVILSRFFTRSFRDALRLKIPLGAPGGEPFRPPNSLIFLIKALKLLELAGLVLLCIAAAGPLFITNQTVWLNRGADILFVLDVSPSMAALDMNGKSRFDAARTLIRDFALNRPSDALGLVAVGNDAALLTPPTIDHDTFLARLETLRIGELGDGTALGLGLGIAALHIRNTAGNSGPPRKAVVLITDGENNAGSLHPGAAAALLPPLGASLWVIAVGSGGEVPIDYLDPFTKKRQVGVFDSRFDPESLKAVAQAGAGAFIAAASAEALGDAFARLDEREMIISRSAVLTRTRGLQVPFIIGAILLLGGVRFIRRHILGAFL